MDQERNKLVKEQSFPTIPVGITFLILGLSVASGVYWWSLNNDTALHEKISELYSQVENLKAENTANVATSITDTSRSDELAVAKLQLALLDGWKVRSAFRDEQNPTAFYFVTNTPSSSNIWVYDMHRDEGYQKDGTFNITEGSTLLYSEKMDDGIEFKAVGVNENKFVFAEVSTKKTIKSCASVWLENDLKYIDIGTSKPTVSDFTMSEEMKVLEVGKMATCEEEEKKN